MSAWGGTSADYLRGYEAGYQEGLKHGGDDGLDIAIPLSWNHAIEAAARLFEVPLHAREYTEHTIEVANDIAESIRKLKKP